MTTCIFPQSGALQFSLYVSVLPRLTVTLGVRCAGTNACVVAGAPRPALFCATTVTVYVVPACIPVRRNWRAVPGCVVALPADVAGLHDTWYAVTAAPFAAAAPQRMSTFAPCTVAVTPGVTPGGLAGTGGGGGGGCVRWVVGRWVAGRCGVAVRGGVGGCPVAGGTGGGGTTDVCVGRL